MKSRIQLAGVPHGSQDKVLWKGELPVLSGFPGMRLTLNHPEHGDATAFTFKQVCLEITGSDVEQVVYVAPVDRSKPVELVE
jgi:hypothetical protein